MAKEKKEKKDSYLKKLMDSYRYGDKRSFTVFMILNVLVILTAIRYIRTYKTVSGSKFYSAWSKTKAVKTR